MSCSKSGSELGSEFSKFYKFAAVKTSLSLSVVALVISASIMGCSKVEDMEDRTKNMDQNTEQMKQQTAHMSDRTDHMADKTDHLATKTDGIASNTEHMYPQMRTGNSSDSREDLMRDVLNSNFNMGTKLEAAGKFYQAFEFQFWINNQSFDTLEQRDRLFLDAANEYFRLMNDVWEGLDKKRMSPTHLEASEYNNEMAFYALAAPMHMLNHHQDLIWMDNKCSFQERSFYDLMKESLTKDFNHEMLKDYQAVFAMGKFKEISLDLIRARVNMLTALGVDFMVNQDEVYKQGIKKMLSALVAKVTDGTKGTIQLTSLYEAGNVATRNEINKRLDGAVKAKRYLKSIGQSVKLDTTLRNVLSNLQFLPAVMNNNLAEEEAVYKSRYAQECDDSSTQVAISFVTGLSDPQNCQIDFDEQEIQRRSFCQKNGVAIQMQKERNMYLEYQQLVRELLAP